MTFPLLKSFVSLYFEYLELISLLSALGIAFSWPAGIGFQRHMLILYGAFPLLGLLFLWFDFDGAPSGIKPLFFFLIVVWVLIILFFAKNLDKKISEYLSEKSKKAPPSEIRRNQRSEINYEKKQHDQNPINPEDYL